MEELKFKNAYHSELCFSSDKVITPRTVSIEVWYELGYIGFNLNKSEAKQLYSFLETQLKELGEI